MPRLPPPAKWTPRGHPRLALWLLACLALVLGLVAAWRSLAPQPANAGEQLRAATAEIERLRQASATLSRSDEISRKANADLQAALAERDEEIAGLRADLAFYERFVGATGQRRGLAVHELKLEPQATPGVWHFTATLTQNSNRDSASTGTLQLALEASAAGQMRRLDWPRLRQQAQAAPVQYSFRYFQQIDGDIIVPAGVSPVRVIVRLQPAKGAPVEQSFTWSAVAGAALAVRPVGPRPPGAPGAG